MWFSLSAGPAFEWFQARGLSLPKFHRSGGLSALHDASPPPAERTITCAERHLARGCPKLIPAAWQCSTRPL